MLVLYDLPLNMMGTIASMEKLACLLQIKNQNRQEIS